MFSVPAFSLPIVHTVDFISDSDRTGFNGFEEFTEDIVFNTTSHTENGIRVERVEGDIADIWTSLGSTERTGFEGVRSWYPEPVLVYPLFTGYDKITLSSGASFESIGMLVGSGYGGYCLPNECDYFATKIILHYELLYQGVSVSNGTLAHHPNAHYVGFSGGGFDEVRIWDRAIDGLWEQSALLIDSIEVISSGVSSVPEPKTYALVILGLGFLTVTTRRKTQKKNI